MNTPDAYKRRPDRSLHDAGPDLGAKLRPAGPTDAGAVTPLAVHRDPSLSAYAPLRASGSVRRSVRGPVVWVRPSELPATFGAALAGRGIDAQVELVRRVRRAPVTATTSAVRRVTSTTPAPDPAPPSSSPSTRGVEL